MRASPAPGCAHSKTHSVRLIAEALGGRDTWIVSSEQNARYGTHQGNLVSRSPARPSVALPWLAQRSDSAANDDAIPTGHSVPFNHSLHTWRDTPPAGHGCECLRTAECGLAWCRGFDGTFASVKEPIRGVQSIVGTCAKSPVPYRRLALLVVISSQKGVTT